MPAETGNYSPILKKLRYSNGRVDWRRRNHYMTQWLRNNSRHGLVRRIGLRYATTRKQRLLNVVPGLPGKPGILLMHTQAQILIGGA
jgi:hypothetical protein